MKVEDDKQGITKLVNGTAGFRYLKTIVDHFDVNKLKNVPVGLKTWKLCNEYRSCKNDGVQQSKCESK